MRLQERYGAPDRLAAVIGGGLAGSEAAWVLARALGDRGRVDLFEMRPGRMTPAHSTASLAELVCSNSLKSELLSTPAGLLKADLLKLGSPLMAQALKCRVPAGRALAVDRIKLGETVTQSIGAQPGIRLIREEAADIPEGYDTVIIATGPLTSGAMAEKLKGLIGQESLYFYDAIAPIVETGSIDMSIAFTQDRYGDDESGDYLNLPMERDEYETFVARLLSAQTVALREFEKKYYFEGCLPVEEIASRGRDALAFGPLKPVGLRDPRTGNRPYAAVQLRKENEAGDAMNMVGFQTKLTYPEQERVFRTIPGMANARFLRHGSLHRNTYINSPRTLNADMSLKSAPGIFLAGQITGVEGYVESIAMGHMAALSAAARLLGRPFTPPPPATTLGALLGHITDPARAETFQPANMNFSLFPPIDDEGKGRKLRRAMILERAGKEMEEWMAGREDVD
ncbi:MAG: methylenetetrahydrofolate--tRNA-(uracil(54)-C(5))-methyltransferase (FADH(2)-oxidizing) TrmFO [Nitrospinae bacterium]|nr:methylenetetrahydrofolate--tRNA-(uracil(54)-C(5))-methyltransferase (FADH(2)-oxidizing) TrmFO [Nitrospinota bacterium]